MKDRESDLGKNEVATLNAYKGSLDGATLLHSQLGQVAVALALGLGTMVGWKRIVVTVGEKIGKTHLTYARAPRRNHSRPRRSPRPMVSDCRCQHTHVLSSGIAGTMAANGSGLQLSTIRNIASAWVLTLPAAMTISGTSIGFSRGCSDESRAPRGRRRCAGRGATARFPAVR